MNAGELIYQRRQTLGWIRADPTQIIITRVDRVKTGAGGWTDVPTVLAPQRAKVFWASLGQQYVTPTTGGRATVIKDQLLFKWDADVKPKDKFKLGDEDYEVEEVSKTEYRLLATLTSRSARG